jgi:acyl carrier protein
MPRLLDGKGDGYMMTSDTLPLVRQCLAISQGYEDGEWIDSEYPESYGLDDLGFDSLEMVDFILALEKTFGIGISDDEADEAVGMTIEEIVKWVEGRR